MVEAHHPYPLQSLTSEGPGRRGQSSKENQEEEQNAFQGEGEGEVSIEKGGEVGVGDKLFFSITINF